jgi:ribosomal protein L9
MRVKLLRDSRIHHKAGEIVEVSPAEANFLLSVHSAVIAAEEKSEPVEKRTSEPAPKKKATTKK